MDRYTKFIFTVIAILLALHLVKPWLTPNDVKAQTYGSVVNVNIEEVGDQRVRMIGLMPLYGIPVVINK